MVSAAAPAGELQDYDDVVNEFDACHICSTVSRSHEVRRCPYCLLCSHAECVSALQATSSWCTVESDYDALKGIMDANLEHASLPTCLKDPWVCSLCNMLVFLFVGEDGF